MSEQNGNNNGNGGGNNNGNNNGNQIQCLGCIFNNEQSKTLFLIFFMKKLFNLTSCFFFNLLYTKAQTKASQCGCNCDWATPASCQSSSCDETLCWNGCCRNVCSSGICM